MFYTLPLYKNPNEVHANIGVKLYEFRIEMKNLTCS